MAEFIDQFIIPFFSTWGYLIIGLAALVESVPLLGILVPGGTIVILGGVFASEAQLSIPFLIVSASLGAVIGDTISFSIGKKYGEEFLIKYGPHIGFKEEYLYITHRMCIQYGGWVLIIGRFNQIARPFVPLVVGSTRYKYYAFWGFALIGAFIWSILSIYIGKIARESWEVISAEIGIIGGIIFSAIIIAVVLFIRYEVKKLKKNKIYRVRNAFREKIKHRIRNMKDKKELCKERILKATKYLRRKRKRKKRKNSKL